MMATAAEIAAAKKKADALAATKAAIAAKTGATPGGSQDFSSASTNYQSWEKTVAGATFDMSKFPEPTLAKLGTAATGEQVLQALSRLASTNGGTWQNLRPALVALGGKSLTKAELLKPWTPIDESAIKNWLGTAHYNAIDLTPNNKTDYVPPNLFDNFTSGITNLKKFGSVGSTVTRATPIISLPATADLNQVTTNMFTKTLGRNPTNEEQAHFAKQYQDMILSYGQKQNAVPDQTFTVAPGTTSSPKPSPVAIEAPPAADVAATNFALKSDPARAASNGLDDAMSSWFSTLEKGVGK